MTEPAKTADHAPEAPHAAAAHGHVNPDDYHPHVVPIWLLTAVISVLIVLTVVTVAVALATPSVPIAMGIATVKGTLVCLYFMHLRWDKPFNAFVFLISVGLLVLFLSFAAFDTGQYQYQMDKSYSTNKMEELRKAAHQGEPASGEHSEH
jgi:cytochrome c oxidase subunit 4